jgi:hypothetical protein
MRTLGFRTHVLLAIAAAVALVGTLSRPWYALAPLNPGPEKQIGDVYGPLDGFFRGVERWVTEGSGTTGWVALDQIALAMAAMAGLSALGALASMSPTLQPVARGLLRYSSIAVFALATWKLLDPPGSNGTHELRYGAFAGFACACVVVTCGIGVANAPSRRRTRPVAYSAPPAPSYETAGSSPPPGL